MGLKMYAGLAGVIAVGAAVSQADKSMNHVSTDAVVTKATVDCYIENSQSKLIDKTTNEMAYLDCTLAPYAASMHGYAESDIHKRVHFEFAYTSPADGSRQTGEHTTSSGVERYDEQGEPFTIYAHKSEPSRNRF